MRYLQTPEYGGNVSFGHGITRRFGKSPWPFNGGTVASAYRIHSKRLVLQLYLIFVEPTRLAKTL